MSKFTTGINAESKYEAKHMPLQDKDDSYADTLIENELAGGYEFKTTGYRWIICILFSLNFMGRSIANVGFASIASILQDIYGINTIHTTLLIIPFNFMVLFFLFPYSYIVTKFGMRIPTYVAVIVLIVGGWTRMLIDSSFWFVILGQTIIAIGHPLTLVAPPKIASIWFGDNQRALATMIGSLAGPVGAVIGFVLPFLFLNNSDNVDTPETRSKVRTYLIYQNIIIMVMSIPIFFFVKNKPDQAPSISALKSLYDRPESTCSSIKKLVRNKDYVLHLLCFSFLFSVYVCFGAIMGPLFTLFHYEPSSNQIFGSAYIVFGVIGSFVHSTFLDKYKTYKKQMLIICILNIIAGALFIGLVNMQSVLIISLVVAFFGAAQLPVIGVGYQFSTELAYPVNESVIIGFLQFITCIAGILYTFFTSYLVNQGWRYTAAASLGAPAVVSLGICLLVQENLHKHRLSIVYNESVRSSAISNLSTE